MEKEIKELQDEIKKIKKRISDLQKENDELSVHLKREMEAVDHTLKVITKLLNLKPNI